MSGTFLTVTYREREAAKALGARWDAGRRQWYVPDGMDLTPFAVWLPASAASNPLPASNAREMVAADTPSRELAAPAKKGISLSSLLSGVSRAVSKAYETGVWTLVEVVDVKVSRGHVYLGVSERDANGAVLAKSNAAIWESVANTILPNFEQATGVQLCPGIKLLVRARPVFKGLYGFTLEIDAIDPEYTLGDLEARKREIRARLQVEGVFTANKALPAPWDFQSVMVVAPEGGAGLGDFQAEADRLQRFGVCRFNYVYSRFQGAGAAQEIRAALMKALAPWEADFGGAQSAPGEAGGPPDAVVIIRGGGAVNDMAWLNDYDLVRYVCDLNMPVFTGIGHERDSTVLDEVAHTKFDTPSKVIAGIEQLIARRAQEVKANYTLTMNLSHRQLQSAKAASSHLESDIKAHARDHLANARQTSVELFGSIRMESLAGIRSASEQAREAIHQVRADAVRHLSEAKGQVPALWSQIAMGARHAASTARGSVKAEHESVLERSWMATTRSKQVTTELITGVGAAARSLVREGATRAEALMREITGQGPEKTLRRGFALVRSAKGPLITRAGQVKEGAEMEIQFMDGKISAAAVNTKKSGK